METPKMSVEGSTSTCSTSARQNSKESLMQRHSLQEKRRMRNARKRRKRVQRSMQQAEVQKELLEEREKSATALVKCHTAKSMAKTFWDRWRHELEERIALLRKEKYTQNDSQSIPLVDRSLLCNPAVFGEMPSDMDLFVGRGSFGIVKCQMYRGICVAVKEFLPHTVKESVMKEAQILFNLCHPYLPLLLGACTSKHPFLLVMQYYGIGFKSITIRRELNEHKYIHSHEVWIILCSQIIEAFVYLHREAQIIHNDVKSDNILLSDIKQTSTAAPFSTPLQVIVVDFGKASDKNSGKRYQLSHSEQQQYRLFHSHMAPELINGVDKQNVKTDIYSIGKLILSIFKSEKDNMKLEVLKETVKKCLDADSIKRPSILELQRKFNNILTAM